MALTRPRHYADASHETAAIWANRDVAFDHEIGGNFSVSCNILSSEQLAAELKPVSTPAVGEKAVMADAVEAVR